MTFLNEIIFIDIIHFKNFGTILLLAVIGTLIALISTGLLVYCFSLPQVGLLWTHFSAHGRKLYAVRSNSGPSTAKGPY